MAGVWNPLDLMTVRDVAIADIVPRMTDFDGYGGFSNPRIVYNLGHAAFEFMESKWGKEGVRQLRLLAAQERHRRRIERLRGSVPHQGRGVRSAVREIPEGSLQAVPRQGAAGRLRPQPRARSEENEVQQPAVDRAVAVGRSHGGRHRQSQGPGARSRPHLDEGRTRHPQSHSRLRQGPRLRVHRRAGRPVEYGSLDELVAGRRPARLLRPHREAAVARHPERGHGQDRAARSR